MRVSELIDELKTYNPNAEISREDSETILLSYISENGADKSNTKMVFIEPSDENQSKKMVDVVLNLDSLILNEGESVDDVLDYLKQKYQMGYSPSYEILYEEAFDE